MSKRAALPRGWRSAWNAGRAVLVHASLPAKFSGQALAQAWLATPQAKPFFLLETPTGPPAKRFSLLAGEPLFVLEGRGARCAISRGKQRFSLRLKPEQALARLGRAMAAQGCSETDGLLPLVGGLSFEAGARFEAWRLPKAEPVGLPDWLWALPSKWAWRGGTGQAWQFRQLAPSPKFLQAMGKALRLGPRQLEALAEEPALSRVDGWLQGLEARLARPLPLKAPRKAKLLIKDTRSAVSFGRMVRKAQAAITAGEYYQANLSHALSASYQGDAFQLYQRLLKENPSAMAAFVDLGDIQVISASPERLFRQRGQRVETWPIAGTAPNLGRQGEVQALRNSVKDGAEHVMLVDLERNDLGRVCAIGSVKVPRFKFVQTLAHVHHLVSQVTGKLAQGKDFFDLLEAGFPGGSITGAPKSRVLRAIAELEGQRRGWYTGGLGYWDALNKKADFNILIRSAFAKAGRLHWNVGSGIVADSKAAAEWRETLAKGKALAKVLRARP